MVLLIMKLDQLDQDIENALSTSSSPSGTPANLRRHIPVSFPLLTSFPMRMLPLFHTVPLANETSLMGALPICDPDMCSEKISQVILCLMRYYLKEKYD